LWEEILNGGFFLTEIFSGDGGNGAAIFGGGAIYKERL
jgi:hypothetical protein